MYLGHYLKTHKFSIVNDTVYGNIKLLDDELQSWDVHSVDNGIGHYEFWGATGIHHDYQVEANEDIDVEIEIDYKQAECDEDIEPEDYIDWILDNVNLEFHFDSHSHIDDEAPNWVYKKIPHITADYVIKKENIKIDKEKKIITCTLNWGSK